MIFHRPYFKGHLQPLVHIFVSNARFILLPDSSVLKADYRTFEEYRRIYTAVKPWQCIAPKELGVWESDE